MPGKPENRESMTKGESRHGKEKESIHSENYAGSCNSDGIRFPVHDMPDKSVVTKGKLKE